MIGQSTLLFRQISRHIKKMGKGNWRKLDTTDVQDNLKLLARQQELVGEGEFFIDDRKKASEPSLGVKKTKTLFIDRILSERSKIPAVTSKPQKAFKKKLTKIKLSAELPTPVKQQAAASVDMWVQNPPKKQSRGMRHFKVRKGMK